MILTPIYLLFLAFINLLVLILPTGNLPTQVSSAFNSIIGNMYTINGFFPIDTLLLLAGLGLALQAIILVYKLVLFIINYARGR